MYRPYVMAWKIWYWQCIQIIDKTPYARMMFYIVISSKFFVVIFNTCFSTRTCQSIINRAVSSHSKQTKILLKNSIDNPELLRFEGMKIPLLNYYNRYFRFLLYGILSFHHRHMRLHLYKVFRNSQVFL